MATPNATPDGPADFTQEQPDGTRRVMRLPPDAVQIDTRRQLEANMTEAARRCGLSMSDWISSDIGPPSPLPIARAWTPAPHRVPSTSPDDIHCHVQRAVVHDSHVEIGGTVMLPDEVVLEVEHPGADAPADEQPLYPRGVRFGWPDDRYGFRVACVLRHMVDMGRVDRLTYSVEEV